MGIKGFDIDSNLNIAFDGFEGTNKFIGYINNNGVF